MRTASATWQRVALRELEEETGVAGARLVPCGPGGIFSLEVLTVDGHEKRGRYVGSHLHLNVTYLAVASPEEPLRVKPDENSGVRWVDSGRRLRRVHRAVDRATASTASLSGSWQASRSDRAGSSRTNGKRHDRRRVQPPPASEPMIAAPVPVSALGFSGAVVAMAALSPGERA